MKMCCDKCGKFFKRNRLDFAEALMQAQACEELARYEDTRENLVEMQDLLQTMREFVCNRCRYLKECRTQEELDTECEICGLSELIQKVEDMYTILSRFDISNSGILMRKYRKIVLCEECEYMAENEHGKFCRMADGMTRWLEAGDGCSCGRKHER